MPPSGPPSPRQESSGPWLERLFRAHPGDAAREQEDFLRDGGPGSLVLFGAGYQGELTLADLRALGLGAQVRLFLDNQPAKWGRDLDGVPVRSPALLQELPRDTRILVTSGAYEAICVQLAGQGFQENVRVMDVSALRQGLFDRPRLSEAGNALARLHDLLGDDRSREVLEGVVGFRLTGDIAQAERICEPMQYFPEDLFRLGPDETFIDGGAFDGDTVRAFLAVTGGRFRKVHAFEPDPRNFARLQDWVREHPDRDRILARPEALYSRAAELRFNEGPSMSSRIEPEGGIRIQAVALDAYLAGAPATFLKYDLEGAEREALAGAAETIRRWRPKLAISVYHMPGDLWDLPLLIQSLTPGYRYHLRHYSFLSFETVFYAVPETQAP
jgi:FkbM family methyltransferase